MSVVYRAAAMTTCTPSHAAGTISLQLHQDALRSADKELREADKALEAERDRRYAEVNIEREKALKIKETADLAALGLAREIQDYKDGKADSLREQTSGERHLYATKNEIIALGDKFATLVEPLSLYVSGQQAGQAANSENRQRSQWSIGQWVSTLGLVLAGVAFVATEVTRYGSH